jgi:hypothetical protein
MPESYMDPCKKGEKPAPEPDAAPAQLSPSLAKVSNYFPEILQYGALNTCLIEAHLALNGK